MKNMASKKQSQILGLPNVLISDAQPEAYKNANLSFANLKLLKLKKGLAVEHSKASNSCVPGKARLLNGAIWNSDTYFR